MSSRDGYALPRCLASCEIERETRENNSAQITKSDLGKYDFGNAGKDQKQELGIIILPARKSAGHPARPDGRKRQWRLTTE
jgi:hypothetical protein